MNKFTSIEALRHVVTHVRKYYDSKAMRYPIINFTGTVKLHGSNGGVRIMNGDVRPQSRENMLSMQTDNFGFYAFCHPLFDTFRELANKIGHNDITIYGEWCGTGIQKNVALAQLPKHFVIVNAWVSKGGDEGQYIGINAITDKLTEDDIKSLNSMGIWFINQIPTYDITIDFHDPQKAADEITELTLAVEQECPWGKFRGVSGIGEGIVWVATHTPYDTRVWFKSKGVLHKGAGDKADKVAKKLYATPEQVEGTNRLLDLILPEWRLEQGYNYVVDAVGTPTSRDTGTFLKWIHADVLKEETDRITANGLTWKDVVGHVSKRAKAYFEMRNMKYE